MKEIGGYFGLEVNRKANNFSDSIALNSGRNCLIYIVKALKIREIYVPFYTCPIVWEVLKNENCKLHFYHIGQNFLPIGKLPKEAYILYTNYFGICAKNTKYLASNYKNLIVDNAQSFYMPHCGIASFNSIRKFFAVPDGAMLYCNKKLNIKLKRDTSYQRFLHLLKRIDINAEFGYADFTSNEKSFAYFPLKSISNLTKYIFNSFDLKEAKNKRLENFMYLHRFLSNYNELKFNLDTDDVPMVYPYLVRKENLRKKLIDNKIYIARYWDHIPSAYQEEIFQKYLLPLPIDQRYNKRDMDKILLLLKGA